MKIRSSDKSCTFCIELISSKMEDLMYDIGFQISVKIIERDFCEARNDVWVGITEFLSFVTELRKCEETRRGKARIAGLSPDALDLEIENWDDWGHFSLQYTLKKARQTMFKDTMVSGGFDLDMEYFAQMVSEFSILLPKSIHE